MQLDSLINKGVVLVNPSQQDPAKTIVVVGVARGGTSIIAGSLSHLGVFMGNACDPVYEDTRLSLAFEKKTKEKYESVIADYNQQHDTWAWKRPSTLHELTRIAKKLRNPHFIFVFRDLLSVANRNKISMKLGVVGGLEAALDDYKKVLRFLKKSTYPALLVSSEKAVKHKQEFVNALIDFSALTPTQSQVDKAISFITPDPSEYLRVSRIDRANGWIDEQKLQTGHLFGWAYQAHNKKTIELSIYINNVLVKTLPASNFYADFKGKVHPTGECGFSVNLIELGAKPSDLIEVKAKDDDVTVCGIDVDLNGLKTWLIPGQVQKQVKPRGVVNLALLQKGLLRGWAVSHRHDLYARVGIYINGNKYAEIPASILRKTLITTDIHPTGECGYEFNLKQFNVKPDDELEVKLEDSEVVLYSRKKMFPNLSSWSAKAPSNNKGKHDS